MKKLLSVLAVLCLAATALAPAFAAGALQNLTIGGNTYNAVALSEDFSGEGFTYTAETHTITLDGYAGGKIASTTPNAPFAIHLKGSNIISSSDIGISTVQSSVRITGEADSSLTINVANSAPITGLLGNFTIESGSIALFLNGAQSVIGISSYGDLILTGTASLNMVLLSSGDATKTTTGFASASGGINHTSSGILSIVCMHAAGGAQGTALRAKTLTLNGTGLVTLTGSGTNGRAAEGLQSVSLGANIAVLSPLEALFNQERETFIDRAGNPVSSLKIGYTKPVATLLSVTRVEPRYGLENGVNRTVEGLTLPSTVTLITTLGPIDAVVEYDLSSVGYNPMLESGQEFLVNGTVVLPDGVINPQEHSLTVTIPVSVKALGFTPVGDIVGFPETIHLGSSITLNCYVVPSYASDTFINYAVLEGGDTGLSIWNKVMTAQSLGVATVRLTVFKGAAEQKEFAKTFTITVLKRINDTVPPTPEVASSGETFIELTQVEGCEYAIIVNGEPAWQDSPRFDDLWGSTEYRFAVRAKETADTLASLMSGVIAVSTDERTAAYIPKENETYIDGVAENAEYRPYQTVEFRAVGGGLHVPTPIAGDERFIPVAWFISERHQFADSDRAQFFVGDYEFGKAVLTVVFERQRYNGSEWKAIDEVTRAVGFKVLGSEIGGLSTWQLILYLSIAFAAVAALMALFIILVRRADGKRMARPKKTKDAAPPEAVDAAPVEQTEDNGSIPADMIELGEEDMITEEFDRIDEE